ncbi:YihY/virulence factor BrkB family protein [Lactobacillus sp. PV037]|uniref:YihY/virulence factor BrkB family protein n=1 Tax=unclassified Lactobacillus TaxID=2620435 RepID=UPI00223F6B23|nr:MULTISPECIES: YihY/virulence factor BrkB family protein [unclassified Lactobacillus]QNQ82608.1 YihY/virulence factor BrkB family protein [Lactobacillus sp. PV012]QNQ83277.1 YihY/virulence factor BrkB family protein [Lactobacillus sp. PV037]
MKKANKVFSTYFKQFFKDLSKIISQGEITQNSIIIAYYMLFSIFPIIIIVGNILPLFQINAKPLTEYLNLILPKQVAEFVIPIISSLLNQHSSGFISFGIIVALWSFSSLINSIRMSMNKIYGVYSQEKGKPWWNYLLSRVITLFVTTLMIIVMILLSLGLAFGKQIVEFLGPILNIDVTWIYKLDSYKWPLVLVMMVILNIYLNYALPNISQFKHVVWPGTIVTVISWGALAYFFGLYLQYFGTKWQNYGIVGTFIVFMLWLNIMALLYLFGVCINATINKLKNGDVSYSRTSFWRAIKNNYLLKSKQNES